LISFRYNYFGLSWLRDFISTRYTHVFSLSLLQFCHMIDKYARTNKRSDKRRNAAKERSFLSYSCFDAKYSFGDSANSLQEGK